MHLDQKKEHLYSLVRSYGRIAVAFSGGSDSSLLARCALDVLGVGNVLLLFARSALLKTSEIERALAWPGRQGFAPGVAVEPLDLQPLAWNAFLANNDDRCYHCKFQLYSLFVERMGQRGFSLLADGTNADDSKSPRPGLRALHELGVRTPLAEAGLNKAEVRELSRRLALSTWHQPASSCLATRIPVGMAVTGKRLEKIARLEEGLEGMGFAGCRVRLSAASEETVCIEIAASDFEVLEKKGILLAIRRFFQKNGVGKVLLDLQGR